MLRLATQDDVKQIAEGLYDFVEATGWRELYTHWPTRQVLREFIAKELCNPRSVLYVWCEDDGGITGFCGVTLGRFYAPPFMPTVFEWGWYGPPRIAATLWRQCCAWGKERGAELAGRACIISGSTFDKIVEQMTWRRL